MFYKNVLKEMMPIAPKEWLIVLMIVCLSLLPAAAVFADYAYITINDPMLKKTPVAVPDFRKMTGNAEEGEIGKMAVDILSEALGFTGYLKIMDPGAFLDRPSEKGVTGSDINYKNWTSIGAELLVTGGVALHEGSIRLELRLFDTFKEHMIVGKAYTVRERERIRKVIYLFCSEISMALTGKPGIFSTQLAFVSKVNGNKEIFVCDFDGQNIRQITFHKSISISPAWSFDGKYLAYTSYVAGNPDLYIHSLNEMKQIAVVNRSGVNITPEWLPDTFALAATLSFSGDQEIYLILGNGEVREPALTQSWGIDVSPTFSPDGKRMAFVSKRSGTPQIFIKELSTGRLSRLTFQGSYNTSPAWSPDGDQIAYVGVVKNEIDIYVIDAAGGVPLQLTRGQGDNEDPTWAPDGSLIAFSSTRGGRSKIYIMNPQGGDQRQLFDFAGAQTDPKWSMPMESATQ